jgi:hypothetical protein
LTNDGVPYGPIRYKEIVKERYLISKHTNTSYTDTDTITPTERNYLIEFITEELQKQQEAYEKAKAKYEAKNNK